MTYGIHHVLVEEEGEEFVGEIVVFADVTSGSRAIVGPKEVPETIGDAQQVYRAIFPAFAFLSGKRGGIFNVVDKPSDDGREIGGFPISVNEAFAETDIASEHAFFEK